MTPRRLAADARGSAAVEFALVALVMMTWIFGMMEAARAFWYYQIMDEVAIEGARCMGLVATGCASGGAYSATAATSYITTLAGNRGLAIASSNVALTRPATCAGITGFSQVTISYTFNTTIPAMLPSFNGLALSATACYYNVR